MDSAAAVHLGHTVTSESDSTEGGVRVRGHTVTRESDSTEGGVRVRGRTVTRESDSMCSHRTMPTRHEGLVGDRDERLRSAGSLEHLTIRVRVG